MNPFERIKEYRAALLLQIKDTLVRPKDTLTYEEHYKVLLTFLNLLESDLKTAEYEYVVEKIGKDGESTMFETYKDMTLQATGIGENLLLFQPIFNDGKDIDNTDIDSLADALEALKGADRIKEDILIIPPGINVFKARLARPDDPSENDFEDEPCDMYDNELIDNKPLPFHEDDTDDLPF